MRAGVYDQSDRSALTLPRRPVARHVPTQRGDVLILWTDQSFIVYAVGQVANDGQQDFQMQMNVKYVTDRAAAVAAAKALVEPPGRRIFLRNLDTGDWSEISN
jgi:hypothetical protein